MNPELSDADWERIVLSYILTGDLESLEKKPFTGKATYANGRIEETQSFALWLSDAPEWCGKEEKRAAWDFPSFFTLYCDASSNAGPSIPERIEFDGAAWEKLDVYNATPERACPFSEDSECDLDLEDENDKAARDEHGACRYCGSGPEEEHGTAYQGEHAEVVYRKIPRLNGLTLELSLSDASDEHEDARAHAFAEALRKLADAIDGKGDASLEQRRAHAGVTTLRISHPVSGGPMGEVEFDWDY